MWDQGLQKESLVAWTRHCVGSRSAERVFDGMDKTLYGLTDCRKGLWWHGQDTAWEQGLQKGLLAAWTKHCMDSWTVQRVFGGMDKTLYGLTDCTESLWWHGQDTVWDQVVQKGSLTAGTRHCMGSRCAERVFDGMDKTLHGIKVCRKCL